MNRQELQETLNKMLVGEGCYSMYHLCDFIEINFDKLHIDNKQGVWGVRLNAYTITIVYKRRAVVSFEIKRKKDKERVWVIKEVVVEDNFVDMETSIAKVKERFVKENEEDDSWHFSMSGNKLSDMKPLMLKIRELYPNKTKRELYTLISDFKDSFWNVDEAVESE